MALQKNRNLHNIDWSYHRVISCTINILAGRVNVLVAAYKDRAHRLTNQNDYVTSFEVVIPFSDLDLSTLAGFRTELYRCIKLSKLDDESNETNFYHTAIDVLE